MIIFYKLGKPRFYFRDSFQIIAPLHTQNARFKKSSGAYSLDDAISKPATARIDAEDNHNGLEIGYLNMSTKKNDYHFPQASNRSFSLRCLSLFAHLRVLRARR